MVVFAWAPMSNHYHLALRTAEVPLWRSMAFIQGLTTKGFNRRQRVREIAERLHKNPGSVSRWVTNAAERRVSDPRFEKRLRDLDDALLAENSSGDRSVL